MRAEPLAAASAAATAAGVLRVAPRGTLQVAGNAALRALCSGAACAFHPHEDAVAVAVVMGAGGDDVHAFHGGERAAAAIALLDVHSGATLAVARVPADLTQVAALAFAPGPPAVLVGVAATEGFSHFAVLAWDARSMCLQLTQRLEGVALLRPSRGGGARGARRGAPPSCPLLCVAPTAKADAGLAYLAFSGESAVPVAVGVRVGEPHSAERRARLTRAGAAVLGEPPQRSAANFAVVRGHAATAGGSSAAVSPTHRPPPPPPSHNSGASSVAGGLAGMGASLQPLLYRKAPVVAMDHARARHVLLVATASGELTLYHASAGDVAPIAHFEAGACLPSRPSAAKKLVWAAFSPSGGGDDIVLLGGAGASVLGNMQLDALIQRHEQHTCNPVQLSHSAFDDAGDAAAAHCAPRAPVCGSRAYASSGELYVWDRHGRIAALVVTGDHAGVTFCAACAAPSGVPAAAPSAMAMHPSQPMVASTHVVSDQQEGAVCVRLLECHGRASATSASDEPARPAAGATQWLGIASQTTDSRMSTPPAPRLGSRIGCTPPEAAAVCPSAHAQSLYCMLPLAGEPEDPLNPTKQLDRPEESVFVTGAISFFDAGAISFFDGHAAVRELRLSAQPEALELVGGLPPGFEPSGAMLRSRTTGVIVLFGRTAADPVGAFAIRCEEADRGGFTPEYIRGATHGAFVGEAEDHLVLLLDPQEAQCDGGACLKHVVVGPRSLNPHDDAFASARLPCPATVALFPMPAVGPRAVLCAGPGSLTLIADIVAAESSVLAEVAATLQPDERVIDAACVSVPDTLVATQSGNELGLEANKAIVVVLTSRRLIVLSDTLNTIAAVQLPHADTHGVGRQSAAPPSMCLAGPVIFILAGGSDLLFVTLAGRVGSVRALAMGPPSAAVHTVRLAAVCPDRAVFVGSIGTTDAVSPFSISIGMLEPVALGFLDLRTAAARAGATLPPGFEVAWATCALGVYSAAHASSRLVDALAAAGLHALAAEVAEVAGAAGRVTRLDRYAAALRALKLRDCLDEATRSYRRASAYPGIAAACASELLRDIAKVARSSGQSVELAAALDVRGRPIELFIALAAAGSQRGVKTLAASAKAAARAQGVAPSDAPRRYGARSLRTLHAVCHAWLKSVGGLDGFGGIDGEAAAAVAEQGLLLPCWHHADAHSATIALDQTQTEAAATEVTDRFVPAVKMVDDDTGATVPPLRAAPTLWAHCGAPAGRHIAASTPERSGTGSETFSWPSAATEARANALAGPAEALPGGPDALLDDLMAFTPLSQAGSAGLPGQTRASPPPDPFGAAPSGSAAFGTFAFGDMPSSASTGDSSDDNALPQMRGLSNLKIQIRDEAVAPTDGAAPKLGDVKLSLGGGGFALRSYDADERK